MVSTGGLSPEQEINVGPAYQVPVAERIRRETGIGTMAVALLHEEGGITRLVLEEV